ncbi:hypothetical protein GCM10020358_63310 [Amorphoplanes nipponensis]|uniref:Lipoprotein n=1 Tax=Actinoplanes nipponensis TaxID=135950 RepID=A0A919MJX4_9ACTN|nr:hypothetical protein [Actinoplanes nipponensis]GIE52264.1 hypothetical protein Ani05nite_57980 [Actinoplanes nipponensis]
MQIRSSGGIAAWLMLMLLAAAGCGGKSAAPAATMPPAAPYSFANFNCLPAEAVKDSGNTLAYDLADQAPGEDSFAHDYAVQCIKMITQMPDAVYLQMTQTTALQGRQNADWTVDTAALRTQMASLPPMTDVTLSASWTYHPDNGLDVIITVKK